MKRTLLGWLPAVAWMGVIFLLSAQPNLPSAPDETVDFIFKKSAHFASYATLALLLLLANRGFELPLRYRSFAIAFVITALYAASDEYHQSFVPGRGAGVADVVLDALGGAFALLLANWRLSRGKNGIEPL